MEEQKQKTNPGKLNLLSVILNSIIFVFGAIFLFSAYKILTYFIEDKKQSDTISSIVQEGVKDVEINASDEIMVEVNSPTAEKKEEKRIILKPDIEVDFSVLKKSYPDLVGWLYSQDQKYNHPIMQSADNDYYLRRLPNGKNNRAGSLFMDFRNCADLSDWNHIIYGHNMSNGSMFGELMKYEDPQYYREHPYLFYFTADSTYRLEIFAGVHTTTASVLYTYPETEEMRNEYIDYALEHSVFDYDVWISADDPILVLSTCGSSTVQNDERFVLIAKLVPLEVS